MPSIDEIIQREVNPFDTVTFYTGNFWEDPQAQTLSVNSIHQKEINRIETVLAEVARDHRPRTLLLAGDPGSGKSYLLKRLKQQLNRKAFFAYIGPWADSGRIWRYILGETVNSLMKVPDDQQEPQLLLWLKGLSAFKDRSLMKKLLGERKLFISNLRATYPSGIYNAKEFFGVLYDLTNPELNLIACNWLRGDALDEDELRALGVREAIDSEDTAQKSLINLGRISADTQPIVLCFDQLDNIPRLADGNLDLQALFNVNSNLHTHYPNNFLVIISLITNTWRQNAERVQPADQARINAGIVPLKPITLDEAEAIWATRLHSLHQQADKKPASPIFPLTRQALEEKFPRGKTTPRYALTLGRQLFQGYKLGDRDTIERDSLADFKFLWLQEFKKIEKKITRIRDFSAPDLIWMLQEALQALEVKEIKPKLLSSSQKFASYSLSYQSPNQLGRVGVIWTEEPNMKNFFTVMDACQKAIKQNLCQTIYLIRDEGVGKSDLKGNKLYKQIFTGSPHCHLKPNRTSSVHYLATYHTLVNAVCSGELVVADKTPTLQDLEALIRKSQVLHECRLLQDLGIVPRTRDDNNEREKLLRKAKEFMFDFIKTHQQVIGKHRLIEIAFSHFPQIKESEIEQLIQELCNENKIQIFNPGAKPEAQLVCLVPKAS